MSRRCVWQRMNGLLGRQDDATFRREKTENNETKDYPNVEASAFTITKTDSRSQSREKLKRSFSRNGVLKRVRQGDVIPTDDETDNSDWDWGQLVLPNGCVPNRCVICLDSYEPGDTVVWSSNPDCPHVFHESCVIKYLVRIQKKVAMTPCCICRCNFTDLEVEPRERYLRRRGRGGRRTVRTRHNFDALGIPAWWKKNVSRQASSS